MIVAIQKLTILVSLLWMSFENVVSVDNTTTVQGKVIDIRSGEPILLATIAIYRDGKLITGVESDFDGNYFITDVTAGTYDMEASYVGYTSQRLKGIIISAGKVNIVNFQLNDDGILLESVQVVAYRVPLVQVDNTTQGSVVTAQNIRNLPTKGINDVKAHQAGISSRSGSDVSVRGSRSNETIYFLDGIRVSGDEVKTHQNNGESYSKINENKFVNTEKESLSTFALDVDRAAYSNVRRFVNNGQWPPVDAVRIEEMVNYFSYEYPAPKGDDIIGVTTQMTECPWNKGLKLLHVGVQSKKMDIAKLPLSNLVFLIDVSGSMYSSNKLPLVISSMKILLNQLRPDDRVAIVTYAGQAGVALPSTKAVEKQKIIDVLDGLSAGGSTAGAQGIITAYQIALENYIADGNNRVILATDGDFNVGIRDNATLEKLIEEKKQTGVFLSVLGYGMGNYQDDKLQILADKGNGNHAYIDDMQEAVKVLGTEFGGTIHTLAKDVKFQIEFNPDIVAHYRLLGYENRMLEKEDFNDDAKDGGELGMGHQMTAIYELVLTDDPNGLKQVDPLKYQIKKKSKTNSFDNELATIKFRYKKPNGSKSQKWEQAINNKLTPLMELPADVRFSIAVAHAGLLLRKTSTLEAHSFDPILELASTTKGMDDDGYRAEFVRIMKLAAQLTPSQIVSNNGH